MLLLAPNEVPTLMEMWVTRLSVKYKVIKGAAPLKSTFRSKIFVWAREQKLNATIRVRRKINCFIEKKFNSEI